MQIVGQLVHLQHITLVVILSRMKVGHQRGWSGMIVGRRHLVLQPADRGLPSAEPLGGREKLHADGVEVSDQAARGTPGR